MQTEARRAQEDELRQSVMDLNEEDILSLCYARREPAKSERLWLYMDILRHRSGARAQFASCLICFDLARQGDRTCQREFGLLAGTIRALAVNTELVTALLGDDPYLTFIWDLCRDALHKADDGLGEGVEELAAAGTPPAVLNLLADDELPDLPSLQAAPRAALWRQFDDAVEAFLGGTVGVPLYDPDAGFRLRNGRDAQRIETFLQAMEAVAAEVPPARGYRALALLFYGSRMRSHSLFGTVNARKEALLRAGLAAFVEHPAEVQAVVGVLGVMHAEPDAWPKVVEVLRLYLSHLAEGSAGALAAAATWRLGHAG